MYCNSIATCNKNTLKLGSKMQDKRLHFQSKLQDDQFCKLQQVAATCCNLLKLVETCCKLQLPKKQPKNQKKQPKKAKKTAEKTAENKRKNKLISLIFWSKKVKKNSRKIVKKLN